MLRLSLVSFLLDDPNMQWCISVDIHLMVESRSTKGAVCHMNNLPGFSQDHKIPLS